jgi:hypothetical protein
MLNRQRLKVEGLAIGTPQTWIDHHQIEVGVRRALASDEGAGRKDSIRVCITLPLQRQRDLANVVARFHRERRL